MQLDAEEQAMLRGEKGRAVQEALQFQIEVIEPTMAHLDHSSNLMPRSLATVP